MKEDLEKKIQELEAQMLAPEFWNDKAKAQSILKEISDLKNELLGKDKYNKGDAIMTIFSGAGGDDAEDFSRILYEMYSKLFIKRGWSSKILDESENDHGGYRNITIEISGPSTALRTSKNGPYGDLKGESGVHRLVRQSPFNSKALRQTSFSLVEVVPKIEKNSDIEIPEIELRLEISKAGGPGGQNVNKRETAVRIIHIPTNISVRATSERSQGQNKEKAMEILKGKLFAFREKEKEAESRGMKISKTVSIEWGSQIRSYVFHPYKMIKDHRTNVETSNIDKVLEGNLEEFIEAEQKLI